MKFSRIVASGGAMALVGASVLLGAGAAQADDYFVNDGEFVGESSPYDEVWFVGNPGLLTDVESKPEGLQITGPTQILKGITPTSDLLGLVAGADATIVDGTATFQVPIFTGNNETGYTTLRPAPGTALNDVAGDWITSWAWGDYAAQDVDSLENFAAAMSGNDYKILAFGLFVDDSATVKSITWDGDTHYFAPWGIAVPTPVTPEVLVSEGVSVTFDGFSNYELSDGTAECVVMDGDEVVHEFDGEVIEEGSFTVTYQPSEALPDGSYSIVCEIFPAENPDSWGTVSADFVVAAEDEPTTPPVDDSEEPTTPPVDDSADEAETPVVPAPEDSAPAPALAATGVDSGPLALAAGLLVLGGLAFTAATVRRRVNTQ